MLAEKFKKQPLGRIDPDLCVAMGAGIQAAREMGVETTGVLVDITPYTFGTSALGYVNGAPSDTMFVPVINRNTKLPAKRSDVFFTVVDNQEAVDVRVYQGEAPDAEDNVLLGNYIFKLTPAPAGSDIIMHFDLDLNGILKVKAVEKKTGKSIDATIENAISRFSESALQETRARIGQLWSSGSELPPDEKASAPPLMPNDLADIIRRTEDRLEQANPEDQSEMINLIEDIRDAVKEGRLEDARAFKDELDDILFYLEA
jgi:molecular chaperone DnaK (HSP70)